MCIRRIRARCFVASQLGSTEFRKTSNETFGRFRNSRTCGGGSLRKQMTFSQPRCLSWIESSLAKVSVPPIRVVSTPKTDTTLIGDQKALVQDGCYKMRFSGSEILKNLVSLCRLVTIKYSRQHFPLSCIRAACHLPPSKRLMLQIVQNQCPDLYGRSLCHDIYSKEPISNSPGDSLQSQTDHKRLQ